MPMILMRFMFPLPLGRWRSPSVDRSDRRSTCLLSQSHPAAGRADAWCLHDICSLPLSEHVLHRPDDPISRDQHASDDDETEDHELERRRQAHHPHHLVEPGEEERRDPRRQRTGQTARERRAADDHGGDRTQEVGSADGDADGAEERRQQDPRHAVEDRGHHVGRHLVEIDPESGDRRGGRVGADHLEPPAGRREPEQDDQHERDRHPHPEGSGDAEETRRCPRGEPIGDRGLDRDLRVVAEGDAAHDLPHRERDDEGVEPEAPDEDPVDQPDHRGQHERDADARSRCARRTPAPPRP